MKLGGPRVIREQGIAFHVDWGDFLTKERRERLRKLFLKITFA